MSGVGPWWSRTRRVLSGLLDAAACWARMVPGISPPGRRFVTIQVCGCSHVAAHALGPRHHAAQRALRGVDRSIARIARVVRRVPAHAYDLFILSDHGQTRSVPFHEVAGTASVAGVILGCLAPAAGRPSETAIPTSDLASAPRPRTRRCRSGRSCGGGRGASWPWSAT
jgi:hypothetical protein